MIGWLQGYPIGPVNEFPPHGHSPGKPPFVRNAEPQLQQSRFDAPQLDRVRQARYNLQE